MSTEKANPSQGIECKKVEGVESDLFLVLLIDSQMWPG